MINSAPALDAARRQAGALDTGAAFVEIVLMDTKKRSIQRFSSRGDDDELAWHRQVRDIFERAGGRHYSSTCTSISPG